MGKHFDGLTRRFSNKKDGTFAKDANKQIQRFERLNEEN
jgi:hypothetical protein